MAGWATSYNRKVTDLSSNVGVLFYCTQEGEVTKAAKSNTLEFLFRAKLIPMSKRNGIAAVIERYTPTTE